MAMSDRRRKLFMFLIIPVTTATVMLAAPAVLPDSWHNYIVFGVPIALVVAIAIRHGFMLPSDFLPRWTKAHGITITDENRSVIRRYLLHGRRIRTTGALLGYIGYTTYAWITHDDLPFGWLVAVFGGYLVGAAVAEVWALRPQPGTVRAASLTPRSVHDYLPGLAVFGLRAVPTATVLLAALWPLVPKRVDGFTPADRVPDLDGVVGWTIASVVLAILVEITARRIVNRPQPVRSEELVVADDAIRSTSLHCLAGAGLALMLGVLTANLIEFGGFIWPRPVEATIAVCALLAGVGTPFVWLHLGIDQPWVVRRSRRNEPVAA